MEEGFIYHVDRGSAWCKGKEWDGMEQGVEMGWNDGTIASRESKRGDGNERKRKSEWVGEWVRFNDARRDYGWICMGKGNFFELLY